MSTVKLKVPARLEPLLAPMRYKGAYGGRGGAKSHFFAQLLIIKCISEQTRGVCIREVQNSIQQSVRQLLIDKIITLGLDDYFSIFDSEIRGKNGSLIVFRGMQSYNAANIKSLEGFDIAWVEEAQTLSQHSLDLLRPTLRKAGSELWFSWNPQYKTDPVDKFFRKTPPDNAISVLVNWDDNPWFKDTSLYNDMLADYAADPDKAEHVWGGDYGSSQGAILSRWVNEAERDGRIVDNIVCDNAGAPVIVSCDLGYRDTSGWWYWQPMIGGSNVLAYDADNGLDADDWIPRIKEKLKDLGVKNLGKIWLPHDARHKTFQSKHTSQQRFISAFGATKVGIVPISKKADQIEAARTYIKKCAFNKTECDTGLDGLRAWEFDYNDDDGVFSREPRHNWASHPADAFAYGCQVLREPTVNDTKPKEPKFFHEQTLEELWRENNRKSGRI